MTALATERSTPQYSGEPLCSILNYPQKGSTTIYEGSIVVLNGGYAAPATATTGLISVGVALKTQANAGASGAVTIDVRPGVWRFGNSLSGDLIAQADVGADCYLVDDQTVAKTSDTGARSRAGKVVGIDSVGVWVQLVLGT